MTSDSENVVEALARADPNPVDVPIRIGIRDLLEMVLPALEYMGLQKVPPAVRLTFFDFEGGFIGS